MRQNLFGLESSSKVELTYKENEIDKTSVKLLITITSTDGIKEIEMPDKDVIKCNGIKEKIGIDYTVKYNTEYKIIITTAKEEKVEKILYVERKVEIKLIKQPIVNTNPNADISLNENSIDIGITLYINFKAVLEDMPCKIKYNGNEIQLPYKVTTNDKYIFTAEGEYNGKIITKDIEVAVFQFKAARNLVEYDAGEWTEEEIQELEKDKLYGLNLDIKGNEFFRVNDENGLNFTFGGFTYNGSNYSLEKGVIFSRNKSVTKATYRAPKYEGWQIFEEETRRNQDGIERRYVKTLIHAGSPETFMFCNRDVGARGAVYVLSSGREYKEYSVLKTGNVLNYRKWDMYRDKKLDAKGYIKGVHIMTEEEMQVSSADSTLNENWNWLATIADIGSLRLNYGGEINLSTYGSCGIRPIIEMEEGVYIAGGTGIASDPYILGKE